MIETGPIYIAGVSYSGKTQMRLMLSAHPNIVITRRTYMWRKYYNKFGNLGDSHNFERCLEAMLDSRHIQTLKPDPERIRQEFWQDKPSYARLFDIFHRHFAESLGKKRWGDQHGSLENDADLIFTHQPQALILHMVRNPLDRIEESVSRSAHRRGKIGWETSFWQRSSRLALHNLEKFPGHYMIVHCERLFSDPETTLHEVCDFIKESFNPQMLAVEGLMKMGIKVPEKYTGRERTKGIKTPQVSNMLSLTERSFIQSHVKSEMSALGYPNADQRMSFSSALKYAFLDYPLNMAGLFLWETWGSRKLRAPKISLEHRS